MKGAFMSFNVMIEELLKERDELLKKCPELVEVQQALEKSLDSLPDNPEIRMIFLMKALSKQINNAFIPSLDILLDRIIKLNSFLYCGSSYNKYKKVSN